MKHNQIITIFATAFAMGALFPLQAQQADKPLGNYVVISPEETADEIITRAANISPSSRQYEWQKLEMTGFVHFGINTFSEVEWGSKGTDITPFNPKELDARQWVKTFQDAGIKLMILTTKHHDGFCLWPSKYTEYDITNTPYKNGNGDVVRELSNACHEAGMKFGVYLSPWDMNEASYGTPEYNTYFLNQLTELLTNYGEVSEVWFDGANGEGPNGRKHVYDWQSIYRLIRKLQPNAVIAVMGPDVRWVGTESGYGRQTEWSVLPGSKMNQDEIAANSQQAPGDGAFVPGNLMDEDLGSRAIIDKASSLIWYPAEIDVSIRPGWFYKKEEDEFVKDPYKLMDIYYNSIGLNGVLLLNIPPDKRGLITDEDITSLKGFRYLHDETFKENIAEHAKAESSSETKGHSASNTLDSNPETYWQPSLTDTNSYLILDLDNERSFNTAVLQENILVGQRMEKSHLEYWNGIKWINFANATTIGYKRLIRFPEVTTSRVKLVIDKSRLNPAVGSFGLYLAPPEVSFNPNGAAFTDGINVNLECDQKDSKIYFTLDGSEPTENSKEYNAPFYLNKSVKITAIAVSSKGKRSLPVSRIFSKAKYGIKYNSRYVEKYAGKGELTLVDGQTGCLIYTDGNWQGWEGNDVDVVLDLHERKRLRKLSINFLCDNDSWLFLPKAVEYYGSNDGKDFSLIGTVKNEENELNKEKHIKSFSLNADSEFLYIKVIGRNIGVCPQGHKGAGNKAWLFADEITVE